eukprot:9392209-Ditylum_brightwellii.AAC.1
MSLQAEWQYLQQTVPGAGKHMGAIEEALRDDFIPALFGGSPPPGMREIFGHSVQQGGLNITNPVETAQHCHATSTSCCSILVESL